MTARDVDTRRRLFLYHVLPVLVGIGYYAAVKLFPRFSSAVLSTETGLIELGTAALFAAAGWGGFTIARNPSVPRFFRAMFVLFTIAALLITGEETSYGQHFVHWKTPAWFAAHNVNDETNLHNLFHNKPSRRFSLAAHIAFPLCFIAVPAAVHLRGRRLRRGEWGYYLIPGLELATIVLVSFAVNAPNKLPEWLITYPWRGPELREVQELFWAWAAFGYTQVIRNRLR